MLKVASLILAASLVSLINNSQVVAQTVAAPAAVSEIHGNFIVNQGGASALELLTLIEFIQEKARDERNVELETEIKILGDDESSF